MRVPWTARRSNQSILKEIGPEHSLEGLMVKLNFQYLGDLMRRTDSLEKTLMLRRQEDKGTTEDEMIGWHHQLNEHELGNMSKFRELVMDRVSWHAAVHEVANVRHD